MSVFGFKEFKPCPFFMPYRPAIRDYKKVKEIKKEQIAKAICP